MVAHDLVNHAVGGAARFVGGGRAPHADRRVMRAGPQDAETRRIGQAGLTASQNLRTLHRPGVVEISPPNRETPLACIVAPQPHGTSALQRAWRLTSRATGVSRGPRTPSLRTRALDDDHQRLDSFHSKRAARLLGDPAGITPPPPRPRRLTRQRFRSGRKTLDLSPRVNGRLQAARANARAQASAFGSRIGEGTTLPLSTPDGVDLRATRIRPDVVSALDVRDVNIVLERLAPLADEDRFDLIVATNILVYYSVFEQSLALANVASMLRADDGSPSKRAP
jgi:hypothetical protein